MHCLINRKTLFQSQFAVKIGKNNDEKITRYEMIKFTDVPSVIRRRIYIMKFVLKLSRVTMRHSSAVTAQERAH